MTREFEELQELPTTSVILCAAITFFRSNIHIQHGFVTMIAILYLKLKQTLLRSYRGPIRPINKDN